MLLHTRFLYILLALSLYNNIASASSSNYDQIIERDALRYGIRNDTAYVLGLVNKITADLVIPRIIDGYTVFAVESKAFAKNNELLTVDMDNVKVIGEGAFLKCRNLKNVKLQKVDSIANKAFYKCRYIKSLVADTLRIIGESAFRECPKLKHLSIKNVRFIGDNAFSYCYGLKRVEIPRAEHIGYFAFNYCLELRTVKMPRKSCCIEPNAFAGCIWNPYRSNIISSCD